MYVYVIRTGTTELHNTNCPLRRKQHGAHALEICVCLLLMTTDKSAHLLIFGFIGKEGGKPWPAMTPVFISQVNQNR